MQILQWILKRQLYKTTAKERKFLSVSTKSSTVQTLEESAMKDKLKPNRNTYYEVSHNLNSVTKTNCFHSATLLKGRRKFRDDYKKYGDLKEEPTGRRF